MDVMTRTALFVNQAVARFSTRVPFAADFGGEAECEVGAMLVNGRTVLFYVYDDGQVDIIVPSPRESLVFETADFETQSDLCAAVEEAVERLYESDQLNKIEPTNPVVRLLYKMLKLR